MGEPQTVELRIQKVDLDSAEGRLIEFIKKGKLGGVSLAPTQIALSMLSMCLQPFADEASVSNTELKRRTTLAVELLLLHCKNLCNWAGLDFASFFASVGQGVSAHQVTSTPPTVMSSESDSDLEQETQSEGAGFSLSRANFNDLGL